MTTPATNGTSTASRLALSQRDEVRLVLLEAEKEHPTTLDRAWWPRSARTQV